MEGAYDGGLFSDIRAVLEHAPRINLDVTIPDLIPGRLLRITTVAIIAAYNVVRLEYEVVPIGETPSRDNAKASRALGPHIWLLSGRDNLGNHYEDWGGTYGIRQDGLLVDGERDLQPAPPPEALWLEIAFHTAGEPEDFEHARSVLKIGLPLNGKPLEQE